MPNADSLLEKIRELMPQLKGETSVEITITVGENDPVSEFIDSLSDLDELSPAELEEVLGKCRELLDQLEQDEPDEEDEDAHDEWEDRCSDLEDKIEEIEDILDDLEDE